MKCEVLTKVHNKTLYVDFDGVLDFFTVDDVKIDIPGQVRHINLNFLQLEFIDSTGIGIILSLIYEAAERSITVEFTGLRVDIYELFETVGVFKILNTLLKGGA